MIDEYKLRTDIKKVINNHQRYSNGPEELIDNIIEAIKQNIPMAFVRKVMEEEVVMKGEI